jgi:hypothetical protein
VYAIAPGKITTATPAANSYCVQTVDDSTIKLFYVHTYKWLPVGTRVSVGDIICYIAPKSLNGGFPTHLHLGTDLNHYLMNYLSHDIRIGTGYADIRAEWFTSDGTFNWSLFKDWDYRTDAPEITLLPVGTKLVFSDNMNLRNELNVVIDTISKNAVCEISAVSSYHDGYQWYKVSFLNRTGYIADTSRNVITNNPLTNIDGSVPTPQPEPQPEVPTQPEPEPTTPETPNTPSENTGGSESTTEPQTPDTPQVVHTDLGKWLIELFRLTIEWIRGIINK